MNVTEHFNWPTCDYFRVSERDQSWAIDDALWYLETFLYNGIDVMLLDLTQWHRPPRNIKCIELTKISWNTSSDLSHYHMVRRRRHHVHDAVRKGRCSLSQKHSQIKKYFTRHKTHIYVIIIKYAPKWRK